MSFIKDIDKLPNDRREAIYRLEHALKNPGRFSVLLLGERGTGKSFWLESLTQKTGAKLLVLHPAFSEETKSWWQQKFEATNGGVLAIDEADQLSQKSQDILFRILSTSNGCFGWEEKTLVVRIVFISSKPIVWLRDTDTAFSNQFFDRIGQLIVEMPNLKNIENGELWQDFMSTWNKMKFSTKMPGYEWKVWLERQQQQLHGNFRDLDKICINFDHFQQMGNDEKTAADLTKIDFERLFHFPEQKADTDLTFEFQKGKTKIELEKVFRAQFKRWAKKAYGSYNKAAKELGCSPRTFEKW